MITLYQYWQYLCGPEEVKRWEAESPFLFPRKRTDDIKVCHWIGDRVHYTHTVIVPGLKAQHGGHSFISPVTNQYQSIYSSAVLHPSISSISPSCNVGTGDNYYSRGDGHGCYFCGLVPSRTNTRNKIALNDAIQWQEATRQSFVLMSPLSQSACHIHGRMMVHSTLVHCPSMDDDTLIVMSSTNLIRRVQRPFL